MSNTSPHSALRPERPLLVVAVLLTALVTVWLFVPTMQGHLATMNVGTVDVTATEYTVTDDGDHLRVSLQVQNPTRRTVILTNGPIHAYDGQTQLSDGTTTSFDGSRIPAGETVETTVDIDLNPAQVTRAKRAVESESVTLAGTIRGEIGAKDVSISVGTGVDGR